MKTKLTLIAAFLTVLAVLAAVYQGQADALLTTPVAEARIDRQPSWSFPTPEAGRTAELTVDVADLTVAVADVRRIAAAGGAQVAQSDRGNDTARLLLTVPASQFDTVYAQLHALTGTVTHEAVGNPASLQDLATLQAQVEVLAVTDGKLRQFLTEAKTPEAVLKLESQLMLVQQELTTLRAQVAQQQILAGTVTVAVTLDVAGAPVETGSTDLGSGLLEAATYALMALAGALGIAVAVMFGRLVARRAA